MDRLNSIEIDCSNAVTDLCILGARYVTDKSPYNSGHHRHPYTAAYDMLFGSRRYDQITFGEIGIAFNASTRMWRSYFPNADLVGFEYRDDLVEAAVAEGLPRTSFFTLDVSDVTSIRAALNKSARLYDILIDDSTHLFDHQINVVAASIPHLKAGGMLVIEDVFRRWSNERYVEALRPFFSYFHSGMSIETNHKHRKSDGDREPYFDNDKLIVLYRNQVDFQIPEGVPASGIPLLAASLAS